MQRSLTTTEISGRTTGLRGKRLPPPIQTNFSKDPSTQTLRPLRAAADIQDNSPLPVESLASSRRQSRKLLGLFDRSKSQKDNPEPKISSDMVRPAHDKKSAQIDVKKSNHLQKKRPQNKQRQAKQPTFAQALAKAAKRITLAIPVTDADDMLRIQKHRQKSSMLEEEASANDLRGAAPAFLPTNWMACIFILTTGGLLLQYSAIGLSDRLPQRYIQLTSNSTASASDAMAGRYWAVQVTESPNDNLNSSGARSRLSRFGSLSTKTCKTSMLLVMETAEQMDSWLLALKSEIASQGSKMHQLETIPQNKSANEGFKTRESSYYAFSDKKRLASASRNLYSTIPQDRTELTNTLNLNNNRREFPQQVDNESIPTANTSPVEETRGILRESNEQKTSSELSQSNNFSQPLLQWQLPSNFSPTFSSSSSITGFLVNVLDADISQDYYTTRQYSPSVSSDGAPNFSVPTFSHRFSHSTKSGTLVPTPARSPRSSLDIPLPLGTDNHEKEMYSVVSLPLLVTPSTSRKLSQQSTTYCTVFDQDWSEPEETILVSLGEETVLPRPSSSLLLSRGIEAVAMGTTSSKAITPRVSCSSDNGKYTAIENPLGISYTGKATQPTYKIFPVPPKTRKASMPQLLLAPMISSDDEKFRPHSMQPPSSTTQLQKKVSSKTLQPTEYVKPMTLRERRSFAAIPSHLLGPPIAPPPTNPLPAIPRPVTVLAGN
ncbi:MAG: hypothetical protein GOMPHAMPRED_007731 [Gomphillus americanus]|uniref:PH domain-containing protein n=1 Tax=Gomphillus americanus TaxID=1940652 RepID=A0A8H3IGD6_9LECA|nr:MAG: hypothetical protein GOMPHAMPRED_007731 [Gomphillus americanus]